MTEANRAHLLAEGVSATNSIMAAAIASASTGAAPAADSPSAADAPANAETTETTSTRTGESSTYHAEAQLASGPYTVGVPTYYIN